MRGPTSSIEAREKAPFRWRLFWAARSGRKRMLRLASWRCHSRIDFRSNNPYHRAGAALRNTGMGLPVGNHCGRLWLADNCWRLVRNAENVNQPIGSSHKEFTFFHSAGGADSPMVKLRKHNPRVDPEKAQGNEIEIDDSILQDCVNS
jgi:hypothetical protein